MRKFIVQSQILIETEVYANSEEEAYQKVEDQIYKDRNNINNWDWCYTHEEKEDDRNEVSL